MVIGKQQKIHKSLRLGKRAFKMNVTFALTVESKDSSYSKEASEDNNTSSRSLQKDKMKVLKV